MRTLMAKRSILVGVLTLALLTALAVGLSQAQGPEVGRDANVVSVAEEAAAVSNWIPIQGRLTDASGHPLDGWHNVTFRLYDVEDGGTALCEYTGELSASKGLFISYMRGTGCPIDGRQLYLGIEVEDDGEMVPRAYIDNVPYAWSLRPGAVISDTRTFVQVNGTVPQLWSVAGVIGKATGDGSVGVFGSTDAVGAGVYGESTSASGYAGFFDGKVGQSREDGGLVKAAVYADCRDSGSGILRSFNYLSIGTISIANGASAGRCTIDFSFRINDRYFSATAFPSSGGGARGVSCDWGADSEKLDCFRWDAGGNGANGDIMVLVY